MPGAGEDPVPGQDWHPQVSGGPYKNAIVQLRHVVDR